MFLRFGGLLMIFPLFVMARIPVKVRLALALLIGVVLAGNISAEPDWRALGMGDMAGIVFFELCAGVLMGLVCRMVFYALEIAGLRISTDSGLFITMNFAGMDVYLNVAGGLRISEPGADLAVASALASALSGRPLPSETVVFGEIGLSGEIRPVSQMPARMKEASKLGFSKALTPRWRSKAANEGLNVTAFATVVDLLGLFPSEETIKPRVVG